MPHGIDEYFHEIERFQRRLSSIGALVALVFLVAELLAMRPVVVDALNDPRRFGFEGPEQYVHRILLEIQGPQEQIGARTLTIVPANLHEGGGEKRAALEGTTPASRTPRHGEGSGEDEITLESRLRALSLEGPVIQSEDLIVEELVRPEYPEEARAKDIEGLVELVALVDTTGSILQVHIIGGTHQPALEQAAATAVLKCRYRPYRVRENVERVWAYFRISFTLY
jgi:TonB family protein